MNHYVRKKHLTSEQEECQNMGENERKTDDEIRIGNTLFRVKRVFTGEESLGHIITEWAIQRTLADMKEDISSKNKSPDLVVSH